MKERKNLLMVLLPQLYHILKMNVSYLLVLPLFDKLNIKIKTSASNAVSVTLHQYLNWFGVNKTWLIHRGKTDRLWMLFKPSAALEHVSKIALCTATYNPNHPISMLEKHFDVETEKVGENVLVGLKIPQQYKRDIEMIMNSAYSKVSAEYLAECYSRTRHIFNDHTIQTSIGYYNVGRKIHMLDPNFSEILSIRLGASVKGKELFKKFIKEDETVIKETIERYADIN